MSYLAKCLGYPREIGLSAFVLAFAVFIPSFWEGNNLKNLLAQVAPLLLLAVGQTFVLLIGAIDLTQGAIVGLSSVTLVVLLNSIGPIRRDMVGRELHANYPSIVCVDHAVPPGFHEDAAAQHSRPERALGGQISCVEYDHLPNDLHAAVLAGFVFDIPIRSSVAVDYG